MLKEGLPSAKTLPQDIEAEQSVLGAMLLDKGIISRAIELLSEECFYRESHQKLYRVILELFEQSRAVDVVTLTSELSRRGMLQEVGGAAYLAELTDKVPSIAHFDEYAKIVKDKYTLRALISSANEIINQSFNELTEIDELLDRAEASIFRIAQHRVTRGFIHIGSILEKDFEDIESLYKREARLTGLATGFTDFDAMTSGLQKSDLIIIAGRPSMGKTAFCLEIARNIALSQNIPVAIFSLEMAKEQVVRRLLCAEARVDAHRLRTGRLAREDWPKLSIALGRLSEIPLFIDDTPGISTLEIRAKARRLEAEKGLGLIIIDYLQLIQLHGRKRENRQQEISEISRSLKGLARELNIPLIAVSQLNRAPEERGDHRPQLSDLRESGSLEQDGDLIAFLFREEHYKDTPEVKGKAEIIIGKQRNGPTGKIELTFIAEYAKFEDISYRAVS